MRIPARASIGLAIGFALGFTLLAAVFLVPRLGAGEAPEEIAEAYFLDTYTWDFSAAWERLSSSDQFVKSRSAYLANNPVPNETQFALLEQLAQWGSFEPIAITSLDPSRAVVSAQVRFPDQEQSAISELLTRGGESELDQGPLLEQLQELNEKEELRYFDEVMSFELVSEGNRWRIDQKLNHSIRVQLKSAVSEDLPWQFHPELDEVTAMPGELTAVKYFARNDSETSITAKAIHEIVPEEAARFFETIECFCLTEQTLAPGEEREMVLLFSIDPLVTRDTTELQNLYTFYSLESFPAEE